MQRILRPPAKHLLTAAHLNHPAQPHITTLPSPKNKPNPFRRLFVTSKAQSLIFQCQQKPEGNADGVQSLDQLV
jgi:hypothetical protein